MIPYPAVLENREIQLQNATASRPFVDRSEHPVVRKIDLFRLIMQSMEVVIEPRKADNVEGGTRDPMRDVDDRIRTIRWSGPPRRGEGFRSIVSLTYDGIPAIPELLCLLEKYRRQGPHSRSGERRSYNFPLQQCMGCLPKKRKAGCETHLPRMFGTFHDGQTCRTPH
jgi:hypothetical protein